MIQTFYIQNMVCDRCKASVQQIIKTCGAKVIEVQLGKIQVRTKPDFEVDRFSNLLKENGFQLIKSPDLQLIENIKIHLLHYINKGLFAQNISTYLSNSLHKDYSILSKTFRKTEGETIEKYFIKLKIEKAKEYIQMQEASFSEIADLLGYSSISHLSGQFKSATGMTMTHYQKDRDWKRKSLDQII